MRTRILVFTGGVFLILAVLAALYFSGWWIPNYPSEKDYPIRGIDVSAHQDAIDWKQVAASGIRFVYLKATEGGDFQDKAFVENLRGAREAGLKCGAYHFYRPGTPGRDQALNFLRTVPADEMALPPAIDLEFWGNSSQRPSQEDFETQFQIFRETLGKSNVKSLLYVGPDFASVYFKGSSVNSSWVRNVILKPDWLGNHSWRIWQFSEKGRVPGINGFVDEDVFNGSAAEFSTLIERGKR